jgi:hypothetical protein
MKLKDIQVSKQITISFLDLFVTTIVHYIWQLCSAMMRKNTDMTTYLFREKWQFECCHLDKLIWSLL